MLDLPSLPGAYVLELVLPGEVTLAIGRLGKGNFPSGVLFYLGSARGPGGIKSRLGRHLQGGKLGALHWHIDYLRGFCRVRAVGFLVQPGKPPGPALECLWSQGLARLPGGCVPAPGFGASDCRLGCPAHLVAFPGKNDTDAPLLNQPAWVEVLSKAAGAPLVIEPLPG